MSDSELKYPSWQTPLRQALLEGNPEKLAKKIEEVEARMSERLRAMASDRRHHDEWEAIVDAAAVLHVLKNDKL